MKKIPVLETPGSGRWWLGLLAGGMALATFADAAIPRVRIAAARSWMAQFAATPVATDPLRADEIAFLEGGAERMRREVQLAELALAQATHTGVRDLALRLSGAQRNLAATVEGLMRRRGAPQLTPTGRPSATPHPLTTFSGAEFDREFVATLSRMHEELVNLFEQAASDARDPEVRELAGSQLPALREFRNTLTELRKEFE